MKLYRIFVILSLAILTLQACDKYLDITPKGYTLLTTVTNYDQWLNNHLLTLGVESSGGGLLNYLGDNFDLPAITNPPTVGPPLIYTWAPQYYLELSATPPFWGFHYANINLYNTVLLGVDNATGGTNDDKESLKAEALLGRAFEYFYLINEYGKEYDSSTASQDLGVPFVTSNDVSQTVPDRSSIQEIYDHIIGDINSALKYLPADNSDNRFRGSVGAAYSILSRLYFYAGDYKDASINALLAIQNSKTEMLDFNSTLPTKPLVGTQQDVIYGRIIAGNATPSLNFMRSFSFNDLRVKKLYYSTDNFDYTKRGATYFLPGIYTPGLGYTNTGTSIQEMYLIVAETAARYGDLNTALKNLDNVRKYRFAASSYIPYQSNNKDSVLKAVLLERNHEFPFSELRWLDMRRLDMKNEMDTVYRYDAQENVIATLPPHSSRYTMQIPVQVLQFNPNMKQNP